MFIHPEKSYFTHGYICAIEWKSAQCEIATRFIVLLLYFLVSHAVARLTVCGWFCCRLCSKGPEADQDDESELSIAELKVQRERQRKEVEVLRQLEAKEMEEIAQRKMRAEKDVGCTWGFGGMIPCQL